MWLVLVQRGITQDSMCTFYPLHHFKGCRQLGSTNLRPTQLSHSYVATGDANKTKVLQDCFFFCENAFQGICLPPSGHLGCSKSVFKKTVPSRV